ncbi:molybdopterin-dependent oxidoreductase [Evansella tamaricis]|uniref:Molybdopterin-dependent oxidoreductase n=1 Tax=Evansella tamaricis TaxID=2069301 RepID=A0ABS6JGR3_9BACI|nr:molybdopterin-dependent oxidoreductase [Evansella tamaricis]MBU9712821.1 molybdopterin-dependent oxidoreductase [Evansella tamaricis]
MVRLKWIHHLHGFIFVLLLLSGLFLYFPQTRTWFNEQQFPLVPFHIWISFLYVLVVFFSLKSVLNHLKRKPYIKYFNIWLNLIFIAIWIVSGMIMYFQIHFPVEIRNLAVSVHGLVTFLILPWVIIHTVGHLIGVKLPWPNWWRGKDPVPQTITENNLERRDFIKFTTIGILFLFIGAGVKWFQPILDVAETGNKRRGYFRIYNVTSDYPKYENEEWSLTIDGLVDQPTILKMEEMESLPSLTIIDDFHCVTGWSVLNVEMKGILVKDIFDAYGITPNSSYVTAYSGDNVYFDTFTLSQLLDEGAMLVFQFDGEKLVHSQGYPCRLYHPLMYGYKSVKWIDRLELTKNRGRGYWQMRGGYDLDGYL